MTAMGGLVNDARDGRERHLLRQHQDKRLERQREARESPGEVGLDQAHRTVGQLDPRCAT